MYSSRDSLLQAFNRARWLYSNDYDLSGFQPPEPPSSFTVESQGNRIYLTWSDNATTEAGFQGYKIYRAKGRVDSTYYPIADLNESEGTLAHEFSDMTAERGQLYFYYIVSYAINNNPPFPGALGFDDTVLLTSSPFYTRTNKGASMTKPPAEDINGIIIVPNPFIQANKEHLQYIGEPNSIKFWNLPDECEINVFTERGDKVYTYAHKGSGVATWNLLTESRQIVTSGIYICTFETPDGDKAIRKLVVVR